MSLGKVLDKINLGLSYLSGLVVLFIIGSVTFDIVARYALHMPSDWVDEVSSYLLVLLAFFPAAYILKAESHVIVDLGLRAVSPNKRNLLNFISSILGLSYCGFLLFLSGYRAWETLVTGARINSVLAPPAFPILVLIPVGTFFLCVQFIRRSTHYFLLLKHNTRASESESGS